LSLITDDNYPSLSTNVLNVIMKNKLLLTTGVLALALSSSAFAADCVLTPTGGVGGAPSGVARVNFDNLPAGTLGVANLTAGVPYVASGPSGTVTVTKYGDAGTITGEFPLVGTPNINAQPVLSGGNGLGFGPGGGDQPNGQDTTVYLKTGTATAASGTSATNRVEILFPGPQLYMGILWGSIDDANRLTFYNGNTVVGEVTGVQVAPFVDGNQEAQGTFYVNITSTCPFDRVVASSGFTTFEFDNIAYNATPPCSGCTYTQGWYKNHEGWPTLPTGGLYLGNLNNTYTKSELQDILDTPVKGNGLISLAHQLITAKLNILRGACSTTDVTNAITAADALIGALEVPPVGSGRIDPALTSALTEILDQYNNGLAPNGPPHCD
jgi:hypothetical protein